MSYEPPPGSYPPPPLGPPGQPGGPGWPAYGQQPQTSPMAIVALTLGCVAFLLDCLCGPLGVVAGIAAIVVGVLARREIAQSHGTKIGQGIALAGIITGGASLVLALAVVVFWIAMRVSA